MLIIKINQTNHAGICIALIRSRSTFGEIWHPCARILIVFCIMIGLFLMFLTIFDVNKTWKFWSDYLLLCCEGFKTPYGILSLTQVLGYRWPDAHLLYYENEQPSGNIIKGILNCFFFLLKPDTDITNSNKSNAHTAIRILSNISNCNSLTKLQSTLIISLGSPS